MSIDAMGMAWNLDLPPSEKFVLSAYYDHAARDGRRIYPSIGHVSRKTGLCPRSVQRLTRSLASKGWLIADGKGPRGTNRWRVPNDTEMAALLRREGVTPESQNGKLSSPTRGKPATPESQNAAARGKPATPESQNGKVRSPERSKAATPESQNAAAGEAGVTSETRGGDKRSTEGVTPMSPEPSLTIIKPSIDAGTSEIVASANRAVDYILTPPPAYHYEGRDKIPEQYLAYADLFHELTGQVPNQRARSSWIAEFGVWASEGISLEDVREAHKLAQGKFDIHGPRSLTGKAAMVKGLRSKSSRRAKDPEWERRSVEITVQKLARSRQIAAEAYRSMGTPFEDPETMKPSLDDVARMLSGTEQPAPPASAEKRAAYLDQIHALLGKKSVSGDERGSRWRRGAE